MKSVACLIIDFNSHEEAAALSLQLAQSDHGDFKVKIYHVDNGSDTRAELTAAQSSAGVILLRHEKNHGYAGGIRQSIESIRKSQGDFDLYWLLNCDLEVETSALKNLAQVFLREERVGAAGPRVMKGRSEVVWGERGVISPALGTTAMTTWPAGGVLPLWSYIPGSSLMVRSTAYDEVGGIPDRYRLYYEETELCVRLQKRGWDLWVEPTSKVFHIVNSYKDRIPARHYAFYFARNNLYFWQHNFGIPWIVQFPRALYIVVRTLVLPLRRAGSWNLFFDRLKYITAGFFDGFQFLYCRYTFFEKKLFRVDP